MGTWPSPTVERRLPWVLGIAAALARLPLLSTSGLGTESAHFSLAHTLGAADPRILYIHWTTPVSPSPFFWLRPLHYLLLAPGTWIGWWAVRTPAFLAGALLPVVAYEVLRRQGTSTATSFVGAATLSLHPDLVMASMRIGPQPVSAFLVVAALWARGLGRTARAVACFVAAAWIDDAALLVFGGVVAVELVDGVRRREATIWPVDLTKRQTLFLYGSFLAAVPAATHLGLALSDPFDTSGTQGIALFVPRLFLGGWLLPILAGGAFHPRSRRLCLAALGFSVLLGLQGWTRHFLPEPTFAYAAGVFGTMAAATAIHAWAGALRVPYARGLQAAGVVLVVAAIVIPAGVTWKRAAEPLGEPTADLVSGEATFRQGDVALAEVLAHVPRGRPLFVVDVPWYSVAEPFATTARAPMLRFAWTTDVVRPGAWTDLIEDNGTTTVVQVTPAPFNNDIRETYSDCVAWKDADFSVLDGARCEGHRGELEERWNRERPA